MKIVLSTAIAGLVVGTLALTGAAMGQEKKAGGDAAPAAPPELPFPYELPRAVFKAGGQQAYLRAVLDLQAREKETQADPDLRQAYLDSLPWYLVMVGEHHRAWEMEDEFQDAVKIPRPQRGESAGLEDFKPAPAVETLLKAAADRRVVMFNEEHRSSVQRAFMNEMLAGLEAAGFTHLALEAIGSKDGGINERGYPVFSTGPYTRDPVFGDLLRRARLLGLTIVPYEGELKFDPAEDSVTRENKREAAAAGRLEKLLKENPAARVIVYAGRAHISEADHGEWIPMAARLKKATGIDPLTVNLEDMVEHADRAREENAYRLAKEGGQIGERPVVFVKEDGGFWSGQKGYDTFVFFPRARWESGRPSYLFMGGLRKVVNPEIDTAKVRGTALLQARVPGESADAVPIDQVLVSEDRPAPPLVLREGKYEVVLIDREGAELAHKAVEVK